MKSSTEGKEYPKKDFSDEVNKRYPDLPYLPKNDEPTYTPHFLRDREGGCFTEGASYGYTLGRKEQREEDLKDRREFYLKVNQMLVAFNKSSLRLAAVSFTDVNVIDFITHKHEVLKALAAFTEEEQKSLPFQ